jgi:hypothetical protein
MINGNLNLLNAGYNHTINNTTGNTTLSGSGTLLINYGATLTQLNVVIIAISNINFTGTWANNGYQIYVPSGSTVTFNYNLYGSMTTGSTAGKLDVDGTCYFIGPNPLTTTGGGIIFISIGELLFITIK